MANHQVTIQTIDGNSGAQISPSTLSANPGDRITFQSQHQGRSAPMKINIALSSGNICSPANPSVLLSSFALPGNNSTTVMMSKNAQAGAVSYQVTGIQSAGSSSKSSTPNINATLSGDPEPIMGDDG